MPNPGLDPEVVARIQGMLLSGAKPSQIVAELDVSHSTVSRAKAKIPNELLAKMDQEQAAVVSDLVMQQLESGLEASITIAGQALDEDWRKQQRASELATFYGVITDKSIRLLEASEAAAEANRRNVTDLTGESIS